jgi:hypothetical protein
MKRCSKKAASGPGCFFAVFGIYYPCMEKLKRSIFFWTLSVLFLITGPLVILYSQGYRFDSHRGVFVHSGTITFKVNPQNFSAVVNGKLNDSKQLNRINSSYNISGLLPGDYEIRLERDGFQSWSKKTDVHSGLASEFWNVLLVRNNYDKTSYNTPGAEKFFISPKSDYFAYEKTNGTALDVVLYNSGSDQAEKNYSFSGWKFIEDSRKENIEWSPDQSYLSVPLEKDANDGLKEYSYSIIDVANNSSSSLNEILDQKNISNVRWDPKEKGYLFFLSDSSLFRLNIKDSANLIKISDDVSSFDLSKTDLYFVKNPNNLVFKAAFDGKSEPTQITSSFPGENDSEIFRVITYDEDRIAMIGQKKDLYIYDKAERDTYFRKIGEGIEGVHFSDDGKKLLFWNKNEISAYFVSDWKVQPIRSEDELTNVTRYSDEIRNVQWFKDYEHIIFSTGKYVKIIELDPRDHRNCMDMVSTTNENPFIIYNNYLEKMYFVDTKDNSTSIYSIDFPEPTPILGIGG